MPGTLQVDFTANYTGDHRVCWRIGPSGPYDCTTIVTCAGLGATCSALISVDLTPYNVQCDDITFEGYVQPVCYPESATSGRTAFSVVYSPIWPCGAVNFLCADPSACSPFDLGTGCHGSLGLLQTKVANEQFSICYDGGITGPDFTAAVEADAIAAGYTLAADAVTCCYECIELTITFDDTYVGSGGRLQYEVCDGTPPLMASLTYTPGVPSPPVTVCARPNSWSSDLPGAFTYTTGGPC